MKWKCRAGPARACANRRADARERAAGARAAADRDGAGWGAKRTAGSEGGRERAPGRRSASRTAAAVSATGCAGMFRGIGKHHAAIPDLAEGQVAGTADGFVVVFRERPIIRHYHALYRGLEVLHGGADARAVGGARLADRRGQGQGRVEGLGGDRRNRDATAAGGRAVGGEKPRGALQAGAMMKVWGIRAPSALGPALSMKLSMPRVQLPTGGIFQFIRARVLASWASSGPMPQVRTTSAPASLARASWGLMSASRSLKRSTATGFRPRRAQVSISG